MTPLLVALAMVIITSALLLEEWSWQRRVARLEARRQQVPPMRCLVCPGASMVDDFRTHTALAHRERVPAPEDSAEWAS